MENTEILINKLENNDYEDLFKKIYDKNTISIQNSRYIKAIKQYKKYFDEDEIEIFSAPGRSEICGNHVDHQKGMVIAAAVNIDAIAIVGVNKGNYINIKSEGYELVKVSLDDLYVKTEEYGKYVSIIRGVISEYKKLGYNIGGFNAYITSDVLIGSGLSSSAAFEVLICTILSGLFNNMNIDAIKIAKISQSVENIFFNKPCGLMDQVTCSVGGMIHIDFKDEDNVTIEKLNVDFGKDNYSLCITDTKGSHDNLTEYYAEIQKEMKNVAKIMGKSYLREVNEDDFYLSIPKIRQEIGDRPILRAIHFFEEEKRVLNILKSIKNNDFNLFLKIIKESGNSSFKYLQNIYCNSNYNNQSISLAIAISDILLKENGACRVHGGGFAGTIQAFVPNSDAKKYKDAMDFIFGKNACKILKVREYGGLKVM